MAHIKKLVIQGFKSFAKKTEIPFDKGINVIIGPNGSGKSNVSDAICFALGRLSAKSMRAEKSKSLIFMGSKYVKPAHEASVELIFDNKDRSFGIDSDEIIIKRAIRSNGQGIYKINNETKTRSEIIEMLGQVGIDPYGYNMILQGQIQSIVKMHGEERRKIIGEVAGISVYEWRKEKSLKELEKTEERLKEINTILRERSSYLNNLEKEKSQAQKYKDLQIMLKRVRASMTFKKLEEKKKEVSNIDKAIEEKTSLKEKKQIKIDSSQDEIEKLTEKINEINRHIRKATGLEQGKLREEVTNLKAEIEGLKVRKEGYENRKQEVDRRITEMSKSIPDIEDEIKRLRSESPEIAKKSLELKKKKEELAILEEEKKKMFTLKTELNSVKELIEDKHRNLSRSIAESEFVIKQMEEFSANLSTQSEEEGLSVINKLSDEIRKNRATYDSLMNLEFENQKTVSVSESEIKRNREIKEKVEKIDTCPLCLSKITDEHIGHVRSDCDQKIKKFSDALSEAIVKIEEIRKNRSELRKNIEENESKIKILEKEIVSLKSISERKERIKRNAKYEEIIKKEIVELEKRQKSLELKSDNLNNVRELYENKILEIEEISSRTEEDIDTTLLYKERELEKIKNSIDRNKHDLEEIKSLVLEISNKLSGKEAELEDKMSKENELNIRFNKMFTERDSTQKQIQELSIKYSEDQSELRQIEDQVNYLKIGKAKIDGERETMEMEFKEYGEIEIIASSLNALEERLKKTQESLENIGSINMKALEVYDQVKNEYASVKEKADLVEKEKVEILKIIEEVDKKKRFIFMKTFKSLNEYFSRNFSQLSAKGVAYLEIENKEDLFSGGIDIVVKFAKGKYFDVNSLSGGEQTLVALSLLFAIQQYRPYKFYILDEIDAALDKRNSERLASLLNQYMKSGQYIVVTHNDAIILDSQVLYGVSMHEGVSKILSLKISDDENRNEKSSNEIIAEDNSLETNNSEIKDILSNTIENNIKSLNPTIELKDNNN